MAKKNKPFQSANFALSTLWGTPESAQKQGGRISSSARRAGVKIDSPLTSSEIEAQKLVTELISEEEAAAKAADPRSPFEKQYDIRDNIAHITPEQFGALFHNRNIGAIENRAHTLRIDGEGLSAEFRFDAFCEDNDLKVVSSRRIVVSGLSSIIPNGNKMIVAQGHNYIGILEILSVSEAFISHSKIASKDIRPSMKNETARMINPETIVYNAGNANKVFISTSALTANLRSHSERGIELTTAAFRKGKDGALKVGTIWHPEKVDKEYYLAKGYTIERRGISSLHHQFHRYATYFPDEEEELQFISDFFNGASGYEVTARGLPIAIVLRADLPNLTKKNLG